MSKEVEEVKIVEGVFFPLNEGEDKNELLVAILGGDTQYIDNFLEEREGILPKEGLKLIRGLSCFFYGQKLIKDAEKIASKEAQDSLRENGLACMDCGWHYLEILAIEAGVDITENPFVRDL